MSSQTIADEEVLSEWDPDEPEPRPPVLRHEHFILREDQFTVLGHERVDPSRMRDYVDSEAQRKLDPSDREEIELALKGMDRRKFLHAQLIHYGIYKRKHMPILDEYTLPILLPLVQEAIRENWLDHLPRKVRKLEARLRKDMVDQKQKYHRKLAKWERYQAQRQTLRKKRSKSRVSESEVEEESEEDRTWSALENDPGQQANLDIYRFFSHYFLTEGKLDPAKTTGPLRLDNASAGTKRAVISRARRHGLQFYHSPHSAGSVLCVGVERDGVIALTYEIRDEVVGASEKTAIKNMQALFDKHMGEHKVLADQVRQQRTDEFDDSEPVWKLKHCRGLFVLQSPEICSKFPRLLHNTLRISQRLVGTDEGLALVAKFDFGVCSGTMYLADSTETLQGLCEDEERNMNADSDIELPANTSRKRKTPPGSLGSGRRKKRTSGSGNNINSEDESSLTLHVSFRGRKNLPGNKDIFYMPRSGTIEFFDDYYCRLKGTVNLPGIGNVTFDGWKIQTSKKGINEPRRWSAFSETNFQDEQKNKGQGQQQQPRNRGGQGVNNGQRAGNIASPEKGTMERPFTIGSP